ncbi:MAG TPA: nucleotidyltransferase family protein [Flavobacterium sp.]|jgi:dTDP-glucose pyrophosphorylase
MFTSDITRHLVSADDSVRDALKKLNDLAYDAILFVTDQDRKLIGSLTDGDLRRGFINGLGFEDSILKFIQNHPVSIRDNDFSIETLEGYKRKNFKIIPILDTNDVIVDILNFRTQSTIIPATAVLMAGGEGKRLRPLTEHTPKPLLLVGDKPIIEYNIDRLIQVGIRKFNLSINYLGEQLEAYFGDGSSKGVEVSYVKEDKPLGTIGSILLVDGFEFDDIIVMNSDLLTNIDFADFYKFYKDSDADMAVAATSYHVDVPYAVLEVGNKNRIKALQEKPRYTYYSNAGIYIINKKLLEMIPPASYFDITELIDKALSMDYNVVTYPITGYWLDIGKHDDYKKAQEDIKHIRL